MNGGRISFAATTLLVCLAFIMSIAVAYTRVSAKEDISPAYDTMVEAASIADKAMQEIKREKIARGIPVNENDILETGMLGEYYTSITTTRGDLEAKRTSVNANWAAVVVGMFRRANLRAGDGAVAVFSGSFPALNICVMAAAQAYGLNMCVMASIGSSYYGANNEDFTFFDMAEHLYAKGIFNRRIDFVSLGGASDVGNDFYDENVKQRIIERIETSGVSFIYENDYEKNIDLRINHISDKVPDIGFVINVGGSIVGLGTGLNAFTDTGYVQPKFGNISQTQLWGKRDGEWGLLQYYLSQGIPVASLLNIKKLALTYGIPYDPAEKPVVGEGDMYYEIKYSPVVPAITLAVSLGIGIVFCIYRKRVDIRDNKYERNYILCRRR